MLAKKFGQILKVGLMKNKKYNYKPKKFWGNESEGFASDSRIS